MNDQKLDKVQPLSESLAKTLPPGEYVDKNLSILRFYVSPKGVRSFGVYMWSPADQAPVRRSIGKWPAITVKVAKNAAHAMAEKVRSGKSLKRVSVTQTGEATLEEVVRAYTKELQQEKRASWWWIERTVFGNVNTKSTGSYWDWKDLPLSQITRMMIDHRHRLIAFGDAEKGVKARGPSAASSSLKALRALFAYAKKKELYKGDNTAQLVDKEPAKTRERILSAKESEAVLGALASPQFAPYVQPYFRLLMLTGARKANLAAARWEDIDLDEMIWRIPAPVAKGRKPLTVYLREDAVKFLKGQQGLHPVWVFPTQSGSSSGHLENVSHTWKQVLKTAGVKSDVTIHDLRRTFGSNLLNDNAPMEVVAKLMGHRNAATTAKHYAFLNDSTVRAYLDRTKG